MRRLFYGYLNVPGSLDVLAVVSPVPGAAEPLGPEFTLEDARHLDAVLGLEHVAAVRDEVLHYTQARIPVLSAGEILEDEERLLCLRILYLSLSVLLTLEESHS